MEDTRGFVNGRCPNCGPVTLPSSALACGVSQHDELALCECRCPKCDLVLLHPLPAAELGTLLLLGAEPSDRLPFELLEPHFGAPVSWEDILDAHLELAKTCCPHEEIAPGAAA